ncbi:MAG: ribbon-helix-helix protein, CopG family [Symploca sp. SIO2D2]|nr:ribbon-helix-helix protein, CopG family [Symploca sp. SIO2D2]
MLHIVSGKKEKTLGIRVDDELLKTLERLAKADERTVSAMARLLIAEALRARGETK